MSVMRFIFLCIYCIYLLIFRLNAVSLTDCGNGCELCDNDENKCLVCKQGFYKSGHVCNLCSQGCRSCQNGDVCDICKDGFGLTHGTCQPCLKGCRQCIFEERIKCVSCNPEYYIDGDICKSCSKDSIACSCSGATFWNGSTCTLCPIGCTICSSSQFCSECKSGYYGQTCHYNCSKGCNASTCAQSSGTCSCKDGFIGLKCDIQCPEKCDDCFSVFYCSACKPGFYGETCQHTCSFGCIDSICDINNGTCINTTCRTNFIGSTCDTCEKGKYGKHCQSSCPDNCVSCNSSQYCTECNVGLYGKFCNQKCPSNCLQGMCTKEGLCSSCIEGYYGHKCDDRCPDQCQTCVNNDDCRSCRVGFYGNMCQSDCSNTCIDKECYQQNGTCIKGCRKYDKHSGSCRSCHNNNTDGENCEETRSSHCINARYLWESVKCDRGCMEGFYGESCDLKCSDVCLNLTCRQEDGVCIHGCQNGSDGLICELGDKGTSVTITGLAVTIALIIITLSVCIIFAVNKRICLIYKLRQNANREEIATYCEMDMFQREDEDVFLDEKPIYMNVEDSKHEEIWTTHVYANVNSLNGRRSATEVDNALNKSRETIFSVVELEEDDASVYFNKIIPQLKEDIDRSSVYGNTLELQQRRIPVSFLKEYVNQKSKEDMKDEFLSLPGGLIRSYEVSQKKENASKNRYRGIYPYDKNRVEIRCSNNGNKYINASYIDGYNKRRAYIACIGPTEKHMDNFVPFWEMVWQENVHIIVMLTNIIELGIAKCDKYWPDMGHTEKYNDITITCQLEKKNADFVVREFILKKAQNTRTCHQVHFISWPDKSIPKTTSSIVDLQRKVRQYRSASDGPLVVHCSAGIGRTGTFIALDILTNEGEADGHVDIYACVRNLREERVNLVQTLEQYCYLHEAVVESLTRDLSVQEQNLRVHQAIAEPLPSDLTVQEQNSRVHHAIVEPLPSDLTVQEQNSHVHRAIVEPLPSDLTVQEQNLHVHQAIVEPLPSDQSVQEKSSLVHQAVVEPLPSDQNLCEI